MGEGQADRGVFFRLKVVVDENNEQQFNALAAAFAETQKKAHLAAAEAARAGAKSQLDAYAASFVSIREQTEKFATVQASVAQTTAAADRQRSSAQATSAANQKASAEERAATNDAIRVKRSLMAEQEKLNQRIWELTKHYAAGRLSVGEYAKAEEAARDKMVAAIKRQEAAVERVRRAEEAAKAKPSQEIEKQERAAAAATESSRTHMRAMKTSAIEIGEAMLRVGRGIGLLGLANEETTEKIAKGLSRVQGAYDVLKGVFEFWRKATEAMDHYRRATQATAVAQEALATAETMRAAAGARAAAGGAASGGGTAAGFFAGTMGAKVGLGIAAAASSAVALKVLWELFTGTSQRAESLTYKIAKTEVAVIDWFGEVTGLFDLVGNQKTAKLEKARAKMLEEAEAFRPLIAKEEGGRDLYASTVQQSQRAVLERQLAQSGLKGPQLQSATAYGGYALARDQWELATQERESLMSGFATRKSGSGESLAIREEAEWETRIEAAAKRQEEAARQAVAAAKERLTAEEQITQERLAAVDKSIAAAREELSLREQAIEKERQAKLTAQERIAEMDPLQQRQFVWQIQSIRQKQEAGETISAEEYRTVQQWADLREFARIKQAQTQLRAGPVWTELELARDEDRVISQIQAGDFGDPFREHYGRRTADVEQSKYDAFDSRKRVQDEADETRKRITEEAYNIEQRQRIITMGSSRRAYDDAKAGLARLLGANPAGNDAQGPLEVRLKDARPLTVSVERDDTELAKQVTADVKRILTDRDQRLLSIIRQEISDSNAKVQQQINGAAKQRAGVVRAAIGN